MGLLRIWEPGYHEVCDTKEGEVRIWGRNEDRKKIRVSYFLIIGKETSSREIGKETWVELGKMGKLRKKCFNTTELSVRPASRV